MGGRMTVTVAGRSEVSFWPDSDTSPEN
jgi:hypothetical protein